jgi:hypothetical protein
MRILRVVGLAFCLATISAVSDAASTTGGTVGARLASCDSAIVRLAAEEILSDPKTLEEPLILFQAASGEHGIGRKEQAAFLYLAAHLRTARQILFEKGDRPQLRAIMTMSIGPLVLPLLEANPELARRVVKRVIDWDRATPDPFRDRLEAKAGEIATKIAEIDAGLARLPKQIQNNPGRIAKARYENELSERRVKAMYADRCAPGTLDAV